MNTLSPLLDAVYLFRDRPVSVPPDLRPLWRLALLVLLLDKCCRQGRASLQKLHVLNWALRTPESRQALLESLEGNARPDSNLVRFDPALNQTLDLARGEALIVQIDGNRYQITAKGLELAAEIEKDRSTFLTELNFLEAVGSKLTEALVAKMF